MDDKRLSKSDVLRLGILAGLSLLLGVYLILTTPVIAPDGVFYIEQARKLFVDPLGVVRRYPPGYPFLLWAGHGAARLFTDHDSALLWAYSAQGMTLLCRTLALVPLYFLGRLLVGARHSFWALVILLLLPHPAHYGSDVLREWPYVLFLSLGFWLLYCALTSEGQVSDSGGNARVPPSNLFDGACSAGSIGRHAQSKFERGTHESIIQGGRSALGTFACAGLAAGLGYLIRPECQQLVIYGVLGLFQLALAERWSGMRDERRVARDLRRFGTGLALIAAFAVPAGAYVRVMGTVVPQQLRPDAPSVPPVIVSVGAKTANNDLLEFELGAGRMLELPIEAFDPQNAPLTFALVGVPAGARPVYQLHSATLGTHFWTISNEEKESVLATHSRLVWDYDGIAWYAYVEPGVAPGLRPVYRFWSPVAGRHFYTIRDAEKPGGTGLEPGPTLDDSWQYEKVAFYTFTEADRPPDAVPVYRFLSQRGYSWSMQDPMPGGPTPEENASFNTVAWYVQTAGAPPAGAEVAGRTLRWRPDRPGEYQVNIIVNNGKFETCQPVRVRVWGQAAGLESEERSSEAEAIMVGGTDKLVCPWASGGFWPTERAPSNELRTSQILEFPWTQARAMSGSGKAEGFADGGWASHRQAALAAATRRTEISRTWDVANEFDGGSHRVHNQESEIRNPKLARAGVDKLPRAVHVLFDALDEDLAVLFFVPWLLGLFYRLRYRAGQTERVLVTALLVINVGLMLARYAWVAPGSSRRYGLGLIALTIFYVPVGIEVMAGWLHGIMEWWKNGIVGDRLQHSHIPPFPYSTIPSGSGPHFYALLAAGAVVSVVWLFLPARVDERAYRVMARWLRENTQAQDAVAVPDVRLSFYADRPEPYFDRYLDPRKADYVVRIERGGRDRTPENWQEKFSVPLDRRSPGTTLVAYRIGG